MAGMERYPRYSHDHPIQSKYVSGEVMPVYETGSQAGFRSKACEDGANEGDGEYLRIGVKSSKTVIQICILISCEWIDSNTTST
jgi:hypothetical protein